MRPLAGGLELPLFNCACNCSLSCSVNRLLLPSYCYLHNQARLIDKMITKLLPKRQNKKLSH